LVSDRVVVTLVVVRLRSPFCNHNITSVTTCNFWSHPIIWRSHRGRSHERAEGSVADGQQVGERTPAKCNFLSVLHTLWPYWVRCEINVWFQHQDNGTTDCQGMVVSLPPAYRGLRVTSCTISPPSWPYPRLVGVWYCCPYIPNLSRQRLAMDIEIARYRSAAYSGA
jgi:hypothetical protein